MMRKGSACSAANFYTCAQPTFPLKRHSSPLIRKSLQKMQGKPVIIRTLDIGADKRVSYFHLPREENPAMGMRAIRICLTRPDIFRTQLRAIYRAAAFGNVAIIVPDDYLRRRAAAL